MSRDRRHVELAPGRLARLLAERRAQAEAVLVKVGWLEPVVVEDAPPIARRRPGRPRFQPHVFFSRYRLARAKLGPAAADKELARDAGYTPEYFTKLIRRYGRPAE